MPNGIRLVFGSAIISMVLRCFQFSISLNFSYLMPIGGKEQEQQQRQRQLNTNDCAVHMRALMALTVSQI